MARILDTSTLLSEEDIQALDSNTRDWVYNGLDCCVTLEIFNELEPLLDPVTRKTYEFSKALQAPVLEMTMRGVLIDQRRRSEVLVEYGQQLDRLEDQLTRLVRDGVGYTEAINKGRTKWWRSRDKLNNLFYDVMGLPPIRKRSASTGQLVPTVDRAALEKLGDYFAAEPLVNHLLLLRDIDKKRGFLETGIDADGRMRCNFNIAGTNTGRLASSMSDFGTGTNLQNVDRELRSTFVADKGWKFANLDLEQGDARNVGAICWQNFVEEQGEAYAGSYLNACESGDLHTTNARLIWQDLGWTGNLAKDKKIAEQIFYRQDSYRQMTKKGGHATNYYSTPRNAAKHLKVPTSMIEDFQINYFNAHPVIGCYDPKHNDPDHKLPNWHNYVRHQIETFHSLTTMLGRRRQFFGRSFDDATIREAIAFDPQSMTADEIDTGMLKLWRAQRIQLLLQVHDSILFQYREEEEDEIIPWALEMLKTKLILKKGREFVVPTEAKIGWNWGDVIYDKDGKVVGNPEGLQKWRGSDSRKRESRPWLKERLSIFRM